MRDSKDAGDTPKLKMGGGDVNALFAALAKAAGFDARLALSGDRSEMFFNPRIPNYSLMLNSSCIAVTVGGERKLFSPAIPEAAKLETSFGKYSATYEVKDDYLLFNRFLKLNRASIPVGKYDTARKFFGQVRTAEQSPIVLVKK